MEVVGTFIENIQLHLRFLKPNETIKCVSSHWFCDEYSSKNVESHTHKYAIFECLCCSILGGIGVVLPWWPIKAYRPCPNFINRGGNYVRSGQGLDEIAFGREAQKE